MRFRLIPTDERFFTLFCDVAANAAEAARQLREQLVDLENQDARHEQVVECERRGDQLANEIVHRINTTFITPFDREDIHALTEALDDVVDDILEVSARLQLGGARDLLPELKEQADLLVQMADESVALMGLLQRMKGVEGHLDAIDKLESEGDRLYRRTLARLFGGEYDALEVLRWKDVVESMEAALNRMEDASNVVEAIVLKHA